MLGGLRVGIVPESWLSERDLFWNVLKCHENKKLKDELLQGL